jgi:hypothetical protein
MFYPKRKIPFFKKVLKLRYRLYSLLFLMILIPVWYGSSYGSQPRVDSFGGRYKVTDQNFLATKIQVQALEKNETKDLVEDFQFTGNGGIFNLSKKDNTDIDLNGGQGGGIIDNENNQEPENPTSKDLDDIISKPANPVIVNFLEYPKYKISAPVIYSTLSDLYKTDKKGKLLEDASGNLIPADVNNEGSSIKKKLLEGVVHLVFSPKPGEYWDGSYNPGCYITGHANAFGYSREDYGSIFTPLNEKK